VRIQQKTRELLVELADYLRALRKSWLPALAVVVLAVALAWILTVRSTKMYTSSVTLFVSTSGSAENVASLYDGGLAAQQRVQSYADLVSSERVATEVIRRLNLDDSPGDLAGRISGHAVTDTVLLRAAVTDHDPDEAQQIANEVGAVFTEEIAEVEAPTSTGTTVDGGSVAAASPVRVSVWEPAKRPDNPISPKPVQNIALGLLAGIALGIGLAVTRYRFDTTVKRAQDVTAATGIPTIGLIAYDRATRSQALTVVERPRLPRAESFRQLRTNLQFINVDSRPRLITITSTHPGDGKTTTALNLAAVLAQSGARVAAIEADLRRPSFGDYLGIESAGGLTSVLAGQASLADVMLPIAKGQVLAMTCGRVPPNPSEILGSRAMTALLADLRDEFDYVIVDAPPLLAVTDAAVVAAITDGTILVARAGRTRRDDLAQAAKMLRNVDANVLGVALNMVPTKGPDAYTYSGTYAPRGGQHQAEPARVLPTLRLRRRAASAPGGSPSTIPAQHGPESNGTARPGSPRVAEPLAAALVLAEPLTTGSPAAALASTEALSTEALLTEALSAQPQPAQAQPAQSQPSVFTAIPFTARPDTENSWPNGSAH
jgi:capsular exopolysaccharide synthesis family protein